MAVGVPSHVEVIEVCPREHAATCAPIEADIWSCPKDEQVPPPRGAKSVLLASPMVAASPTPLSNQARGTHHLNVAVFEKRSPGLLSRSVEEINRDNAQLQAALEHRRAERRRQEENGHRMRSRLQQLEVEVRAHWQARVAELEAEVAQLKGALADVTAANHSAKHRQRSAAGILDSSFNRLREQQTAVTECQPAVARVAARCSTGQISCSAPLHAQSVSGVPAAPLRVRSRSSSDIGGPRLPWWAPAGDSSTAPIALRNELCDAPNTPVAVLHSIGSSPQSPALPSSTSPRARRPPLLSMRGASLAAEALSDEPVLHLASGSLFHGALHKGFFKAQPDSPPYAGIIAPRTPSGKPRARSLPPSPSKVDDGVSTMPAGFLEGFDGFYKQLVHGTHCTGPDVLAVNESSHEIDLSAEFPPEKRVAQVDPLNLQPYTVQSYLHSSLASREFSRDFIHQKRSVMTPIMHHL